jgi:thiosulfate/3-mercaptopyruvate sulfurtransferase
MVDSRLPEFYTGSNAGNMPRAGHIPGATNAPFQVFLDERMRFLAPGALAELLEKAGAVRGKSVVPYCHTGMQASVVYFVARYLGLEPKLYDGSFEDWSAQSSLPIETIVTP